MHRELERTSHLEEVCSSLATDATQGVAQSHVSKAEDGQPDPSAQVCQKVFVKKIICNITWREYIASTW